MASELITFWTDYNNRNIPLFVAPLLLILLMTVKTLMNTTNIAEFFYTFQFQWHKRKMYPFSP